MKFNEKELETIKEALVVALIHSEEIVRFARLVLPETGSAKFNEKEIETIKEALVVALDYPEEIDDEAAVIQILDRIDDETDLD